MKILLVAGGTAGHVNPALAIAQGLKQRYENAEIHFAGRQQGMEYRLVQKAGYPFHHIEVQGIQRSIKPKALIRNIKAAWKLAFASAASARILKKVKPDLVIGTGGYVSGPLLQKAAKMGYKTAIHEQNAYPGVANRILAKYVDVVFAPTQSAKERLEAEDKTVVCGNPVRKEFMSADRDKARAQLGAGSRTVIVSYGGSLGAMRLNEAIASLAKWHLKKGDFLHIHATGSIEKEDFDALAKEKDIKDKDGFVIKEYIDNLPDLLAAADLVISRAGALTLAELAMVGRASVLIPSPNVTANHQYHNAMEFANVNAAIVIEEKELTDEDLIDTVNALTSIENKLSDMGKAAHTLAQPKALDIIIDTLEKLCEKK